MDWTKKIPEVNFTAMGDRGDMSKKQKNNQKDKKKATTILWKMGAITIRELDKPFPRKELR